MQLLKVAVVHRLYTLAVKPEKEILAGYDRDVFRFVDQYGAETLYQELEEEYEKAEAYLPTRFRRFEQQSPLLHAFDAFFSNTQAAAKACNN